MLRKKFPDVRNSTKDVSHHHIISLQKSKTNLPTITIDVHGRQAFLHSKYDPEKEAQRFIEANIEKIREKKHVFIYGMGLGYHIEEIIRRFPDISITVYEPNIDVFHKLMESRKLSNILKSNVKRLYVETTLESRRQGLIDFANMVLDDVFILILPSYERAFSQETQAFMSMFTEIIKQKKQNYLANYTFEKKWVYNSIYNLYETLSSPTFFNIDKRILTDKPVILIAAGTSLDDEIENLKFIKSNKLAYLFSVGSAVNTLLANDIYPDGHFSYDPKFDNQEKVFKDILERNLDSIPLIFGTSIGFEKLSEYPGEKYHVVTSQDTVSSFYVNSESEILKVSDAPTISVIALQILFHMEVSKIILVGQNLAFRGEHSYSKAIYYRNTKEKRQHRKKIQIETIDVFGNTIYTSPALERMKKAMEALIKELSSSKVEIINATNGGAHIDGTKYIPLQEVMKDLSEQVVDNDWRTNETVPLDFKYIAEKHHYLMSERSLFISKLEKISDLNHEFLKKPNHQAPIFKNILREFETVIKNKYFRLVMNPMAKVEFDLFIKNIKKINAVPQVDYQNFQRQVERIVSIFNENDNMVNSLFADFGEKIQALQRGNK
ncbi:motility associated factor glycosyltransferase family protein [Gracilibacillus thailandensis]|uniref:motility associated factor glycosyltransferase family protein n=1 Tax=Gracilibacillus thailandensis TaxID=563735 RepID=UPI001969E0A6|nr:6-hydroxymethylpterin diphosphokinase MptE-like protein [Gracilibacillus thailandensis]